MISYEPLFRATKEKGITSYKLGKMGFSISAYHSTGHGNSMNINILNTLCRLLDRSVSDVLEYIKDEDDTNGREWSLPFFYSNFFSR